MRALIGPKGLLSVSNALPEVSTLTGVNDLNGVRISTRRADTPDFSKVMMDIFDMTYNTVGRIGVYPEEKEICVYKDDEEVQRLGVTSKNVKGIFDDMVNLVSDDTSTIPDKRRTMLLSVQSKLKRMVSNENHSK